MAMDPNSPSYIKEELYNTNSNKFIKETIHFESYLSRGIENTSIIENVPSLGPEYYGKWFYKAKTPNTYDIEDINNRQNLRIFSPSTDPNTTLALPLKIPKRSSSNDITAGFNHTLDLSYRPSIETKGNPRTEFDYVMSGVGSTSTSDRQAYYVLDFWIKIPSFNTNILIMPGWFAYIYTSNLNNGNTEFISHPNRTFSPKHILIGVTDYLDGKKRLICEVSRIYEKMYIADTEWYQNLGKELKNRDAIFFIDNDIDLNSGDWHHLVIKHTCLSNYGNKSYKVPSLRIWFDDILTFTAYNIDLNDNLHDSAIVYPLLDDSQKVVDDNGNNPSTVRYKFAFSNTISDNTYRQMKLIDTSSNLDTDVYSFNEFHFPDITDPSKFYNSPEAELNYSDLFDTNVSDTEQLELKDIKYSVITLEDIQTKQSDTYMDISIEIVDFIEDISEDLIPISIDAAKDIDPVDIPSSISISEDITQDLIPISIDAAKDIDPVDIPTTIDIKEDIVKDLLNPIEVTIGKDMTPVDPFEITVEATNPFKPIEEIEDYINKTYLGTQQAAEDFQLLYKVTEYSYWPVDFSIDNNYHIHIKKSEVYLGATLYACTNKQFLYGKYVI